MSGPQLFRPRPSLAPYIAYFGYWDHRPGQAHRSRALPRGAATIVIDVGGRRHPDFYEADGCTRIDVSPAFITGAGTDSYVTRVETAHAIMTVHFRPAGALPFLGVPLGQMTDSCVALVDLWASEAIMLREQLIDAPGPAARVALLETFLLARTSGRVVVPHSDVLAVLAAAERNPSMRVSEAAAVTGLSPKRLSTLFREQAGLAPKSYLRVRRLQAALRRLDSGAACGATIATDLGYFDQAHFVREFRAFTGSTPTQYLQRRSSMPGHVDLAAVSGANIQATRLRHR